MGLKEIHNMVAINSEIEKQLVSIRECLKPRFKLTEEQNHIAKTAYKAITGKKPPTGCTACDSMIKILNNWLVGYYDKTQYRNQLLKDIKESGNGKPGKIILKTDSYDKINQIKTVADLLIEETTKSTYKELMQEAKDLGFIKEGKGRVKMEALKDFIKNNK